MKTKQEQIEKMAQIICDCCDADGKCWDNHLCTKINIQDCIQKQSAKRLIQAGYGDVTKYKAEIEKLKAKIKQAQIDMLNKLKTKKYYVWGCGELLHITEDDIDELIKEVQDAEDKG